MTDVSGNASMTTRCAQEDDREALEALGYDLEFVDHRDIIIVERDGVIIGGGDLVIGMSPAEPEQPSIRLRAARSIRDEERIALVRGLIESARRHGFARLLAGCDPMDLNELRLLEGLGFAPTGRGPYLPLGGGQVQYITGYQDATGSILDLVLTL